MLRAGHPRTTLPHRRQASHTETRQRSGMHIKCWPVLSIWTSKDTRASVGIVHPVGHPPETAENMPGWSQPPTREKVPRSTHEPHATTRGPETTWPPTPSRARVRILQTLMRSMRCAPWPRNTMASGARVCTHCHIRSQIQLCATLLEVYVGAPNLAPLTRFLAKSEPTSSAARLGGIKAPRRRGLRRAVHQHD